jgi:hypothetical protein
MGFTLDEIAELVGERRSKRHAERATTAMMTRVRTRAAWFLAAGLAFGAERTAHAEDKPEEVLDHKIIVGVGGASELELRERAFHAGGNVMVEWEAVESWLELELSASVLAADKGVEVPIDLIFKKPFRLSRHAEFMVGIGPELVHVSTPTTKATYCGGQIALEFMYWPSRRLGFWLEPSYDLILRDRATPSVGGTGGLLIGW